MDTVRDLNEREEMEPYLRSILFDTNETPHGPAELVDILTHRVKARGKLGMCAFILKGKSFPTIRPANIAHQIYRLEKIAELSCAVLAFSGTLLDEAQEQFVSTANRLGLSYALFDTNDLARLFVAYGFICPRDGRRIVAGRCTCGYSPAKRFMNVLQCDALKAIADAHELKQRAGVVVLPPGSGKTRLAAEDAKRQDARCVLYVAHTHEILDVAVSEFEAVFSRELVTLHDSVESLGQPNQINIATIQLLSRNPEAFPLSDVSYMVVDEFHHAAAPTYRRLLDGISPDFLLGLTATPFRGDRQDIFELCDGNLLCLFELRSGIDTGILTPYHYYGVFDDIDYSAIVHNGVTYDVRDLERALIIPERDEAIIDKWLELANGLPTLAFCVTHDHAIRVRDSFNRRGIPAEIYLSETEYSQRLEIIEHLRLGDTKILCAVDVLNEGADIPFIECLLFLRPTESRRVFFQQLGRGLRRYIGKAKCIAIDFIGNFKHAYRVVEYQGLLDEPEPSQSLGQAMTAKAVLNLPLGCTVTLDDRVIDIFAEQQLSGQPITRHNIARILLLQYGKLERRLGHSPSRREVDRNLLFGSDLYEMVFGSWRRFSKLVAAESE
jgi:superfamily II DNA or RNA helicase